MMPEGQAPSIKVKRMVEEGDQVWVWSTVTMMGVTKETVDIVTFKDGKIVEHYDVQQEGIYEMKE
ncbi:hypothetical protein BCR35DRAFT_299462 [Leucosporidium creatinivorum]|uniref:SnoaL-like domain-containing protein n=1 Tax=Leucosporidium creatinivorum TaxID=106004 RepID=A0A1Y2G1S2_9BASI|nr:hypothetical protein BCR35DRAFT_299462 [Leucosporidium creatinivorum]